MQVKEERIDTEYHRAGQYVAGLETQSTQNHQQPEPPVFQNQVLYPAQNGVNSQNTSIQVPNNTQPSKPEENVSENQVDFSSVKGIFGWTSIDGVDIPYIFRKEKMFVSVRIVEQKLLSKYPNSYPDDLGKHQPLTSFFITVNECKLLNEINQVHCGGEFGAKLFSNKDLIVLLSDFVEFYNLVKKTFPETAKKNSEDIQKPKNEPKSQCGWLQVNNTVTPYVRRADDKFVPLSVMKYAAALNIPGSGALPSTEECDLLNKACKIAGFNFSFSKTTRIISLNEIIKSCMIKIMELPMENPLQHAQYIELPTDNNNQEESTNKQLPEPSQKCDQNFSKSPNHDMVQPPFHQQIHPSYMDPRMMFSYNRHPFNMYAMQFGPPNVTVNRPGHHAYPLGTMRPPLKYMNGQMPNQIPQGSRTTTPEHRLSKSPVRSPSNGSASSTPQPKSPGRLTSPIQYQAMRPQLSPGSFPPMSVSRPMNPGQSSTGHMMYQNPMSNFMQNRPNFMQQNMRPPMRPNMSTSNHMQRPSNGLRAPTSKNVGPNMQGIQHRSPVEKQGHRPPPTMSGPHQAPMNALQSMVSHQNASVPQGAMQTLQRNIPSEHMKNSPSHPSQLNGVANGQNMVQRQGQSNEHVSRQANGPVFNGVQQVPQQEETQETKVPQKCVNQTLVDSIKGVWLGGKSISCMHLDNPGRSGKFCLVEAVCKLYFSGCSVNEFLYALMNVLKVPLLTCTDEEEKAFIHYYSLPVTVLKCNKMIDFDDLDKFFPQLSYVFKEKTGTSAPDKTQQKETSPIKTVEPDPAMPMTLSEMQSNKRPSNSQHNGPPAKTSRRLEDTVQRLMNQQQGASGPTDGDKQSSGAIIILDD